MVAAGSWTAGILAAIAFLGPTASASRTFEVDDYFKLKRVQQLALSADGRRLAYVIEEGPGLAYYNDRLSSQEKRAIRAAYLLDLSGDAQPTSLDELADAQQIIWIPRAARLAFLSSRSGTMQVYSYDTATGRVTQLTRTVDPVEAFSFAADGMTWAYTTRKSVPAAKSYYQRFRTDRSGMLIDSDDLTSEDFVDPDSHAGLRPEPAELWARPAGGEAKRIAVPGDVQAGFSWSSDARWLSILFTDNDVEPLAAGRPRTSLGILDASTGAFDKIGQAAAPHGGHAGAWYAAGAWLPKSHKFFMLRITEADPWVSASFPDAAMVDITDPHALRSAQWQSLEIYWIDPAFMPVSESRVLIENIVEGVRGLFELTPRGLRKSGLLENIEGCSSYLRVSANLATLVFVNESLTRPQEIYLRRGESPPRRLTHLNDDITARVRFSARELTWKSTDGAKIKGWVIEPPASDAKTAKPLITAVHGGPGYAVPNSFAPYFESWPYPLEVLASRGMAIFFPNYRGTKTYGRAHATPRRLDLEPVDDIVTGVKQLVSSGLADPEKLGIVGHSHGAWLGPLTMAHEKIFRAASFAEGWSNNAVMYELMRGSHNRQVHIPTLGRGRSFYESPQIYLESSPDLHFEGVRTASLFEAGAYSQAIMMLGFPKALRHFGAPAEFIIYPQTEHGISLSQIQREAAERNLQWFSFWLNGEELDDPVDADEYKRWREMRSADRISRD